MKTRKERDGRALGKISRALGMLVLVWGLAGCTSMDRTESIRKMNDGLSAAKAGDPAQAVALFEEASKIDSTFSDPLYYAGLLNHHKLSRIEVAEGNYRDALQRAGTSAQISYQLGSVLSEQGKWSDAVAQLRAAVEAEPTFAKAWFRLGLALENEQDYTAAIDAYAKSIQADARMRMGEDDKGGQHYHALGDLYNRYGFYDRALKVYENGLENNEGVARLLGGKGVAELQLQRYDQAAASFEKALTQDPSLNTVLFNLAVTEMKMGRVQSAVKRFELFSGRANASTDAARIVAAQGFIQQLREAEEK